MLIRKMTAEDLPEVMSLFENAKAFMRKSGNFVQWVNGYPSIELIRSDIGAGHAFVCEEGDELLGCFTLIPGEDPTYRIIRGAWLNDAPYATLHRVASSGKHSRLMDEIVAWSQARFRNLRCDTHESNMPMRNALSRCGFTECGVIWISDGTPRLAFQKIAQTEETPCCPS